MSEPSGNLGKSYDPKPIEDKWYAWWLENRLFEGNADANRNPFSIVIPPPNVTGSLHMGHALNNTLQDIQCRYKRMNGYDVLWLPGTDHAGIATQNVVERNLASQGISRHELGREAFVDKVWEWKEQYGNRIVNQLKKLGASCDWRRERFTMDEGLSRAVRAVFVRLYKEGLIYKGKYIINWCPRCQTALSDLEVDHQESTGHLYHVIYRFSEGDGGVTVATTRPETILGDVAIAIHPRDEKNRHLVGRTVIVPLVGREIPIIEDPMVDPEFGTGCVKITPAHDPNDFLVGQRHGLESIQVIDSEGRMNESAGKYRGLDRFDARKVVLEDLVSEGNLLRIDEHLHAVGQCYRCRTVVEPYLSEQWFVKAKPLAEAGVEAVKAGRIRFVPEQWTGTYYQWMDEIRDWCISRQLWWGHRIPAWTCTSCGHVTVSESDPDRCESCGSSNISQDEDVLDTWFSSALWPFSTLGWPDRTPELAHYYPTSLLVTGFDIIFFWVARMIMMGLHFMEEVPFRDTYIHALVRDESGQKMSKSKGNVIDPLDVIDEYGADALRLTLAALTVQGRDILLSTNRIETFRFFLNKLWNASRFALSSLEGVTGNREIEPTQLRLHDRWILARLDEVIGETTRYLDGYFFGEAAKLLYDFVWGELCDWYLEMAKPALKGEEGALRKEATQGVLCRVFESVLKLLHPFIPFLTEELWQAFSFSGKSLQEERWPEPFGKEKDRACIEEMAAFQQAVRAIRNLRAEAHLNPQKTAPLVRAALREDMEPLFRENSDLLGLLCRIARLEWSGNGTTPSGKCLSAVLPQGSFYLEVEGLIDIETEIGRLEQEMEKLKADLKRSKAKLENSQFVANAPDEVVEKEKARLREGEARILRVRENIRSLGTGE
ncbi:MAG: valine--tRNA ligase [Synergistales bacterium]